MLKEAMAGELGALIDVPVERARDHAYLQPDTMAALTGPAGGIELVFLSVQGFATVQTLEVVAGAADDPNTKGIRAGQVHNEARVWEIATARLGSPLALEMAAIVLDQLMKSGMPLAEVEARIATVLKAHGPA